MGSFKFNIEKVETGFQPMEGTDLLSAISIGSFVGSPFGDLEQDNIEGTKCYMEFDSQGGQFLGKIVYKNHKSLGGAWPKKGVIYKYLY